MKRILTYIGFKSSDTRECHVALTAHSGIHTELLDSLFGELDHDFVTETFHNYSLSESTVSFQSLKTQLDYIRDSWSFFNSTKFLDNNRDFIAATEQAQFDTLTYYGIDDDKWYKAKAKLSSWLRLAYSNKASDQYAKSVAAWNDQLSENTNHQKSLYMIRAFADMEQYWLCENPDRLTQLLVARQTQYQLKVEVKESTQQHSIANQEKLCQMPRDIWRLFFCHLNLPDGMRLGLTCKFLQSIFKDNQSPHWENYFIQSEFSTVHKIGVRPDVKTFLRSCKLNERKKMQLYKEQKAAENLILSIQEQDQCLGNSTDDLSALITIQETIIHSCKEQIAIIEKNYPTPVMIQ